MKMMLSFVLVAAASITSTAQSNDYQRTEFFIGYSYGSARVNFGNGAGAQFYRDRISEHGFNASGVVNLRRYVGLKLDVSGTYANRRYSFQVLSGIQSNPTTTVSFEGKATLYNFLGGVQFKDTASHSRLVPFAHVVIGAARRKNEIRGGGFTCVTITPCPSGTNETGFAGAFGGGLDLRLRKRLAFRIVQVDYNPIKFGTGTDHNFRFSTGLVF